MKSTRIALVVATALAPLAAAQAAPMRYSFYDCGLDIGCSTTPPTMLLQFTTADVMRAPAVPPAGTFTPIDPVEITEQLAGDWDAFGISTFNTNNAIGGLFVVTHLDPFNGRDFAPTMAIGAATRSALRLDWGVGTYLGLGYVNCFNASCSTQTTIRGYAKLVGETWDHPPGTVPEPGALALALAALGLAAAVRRRSN